ncbi:MAG: superoxide dismutase family protein [Thermoanaerobaculia bacterium]|nr:superoxide dismutase family protein [Thermoanaerobaculia bacterium]
MKNRREKLGWIAMAVVAALGAACAKESAEAPAPAPEPEPAPVVRTATADLAPREGGQESGRVTFTQEGDGPVRISAAVSGASAGDHGFHIHAVGDCSAADFTSAGGHFNPADSPHGGPDDAVRHAGDLGNISIGDDGSGSLELTSDLITLAAEAPSSIVGKAVILHEGTDDLVSQPTGAAGGRLACGVIQPVSGGGGA